MTGFVGKLMFTAVGVVVCAGTAQAQTVIAGQNVADRAHPEYDPIPIPVAGFALLPSATVRIEATDNFRASNIDREGDVYVTLRPAVALNSTWSRHRLSADAFYERRIHFKLGEEDSSSFGTTVRGLYDISRDTRVSGEVSGQRAVESRSALGSFRGSLEPVRYDTLRAALGISHTINDLELSGRGTAETYNFRDAKIGGGGKIDQDFRDFERLTVGGNARYALRNGIGVIGSLQYDRTQYDFGPDTVGFVPGTDLDRGSSGVSALAGASFELTRLIFGTVQAGYLSRRYDDPLLRDFNGVSFAANVLWNPTSLTSVTLRAGRSVEESASTTFAGNTRSDFSVRVDHELFRYVLISGDLGYDRFRANGPGPRGNEYTAGLAARYLIDRRFTLTGSVRTSRRSSDIAGLRYNATSGAIGLRAAF